MNRDRKAPPAAAEERKITAAELAENNGTAGRPIYIAYQGRVYDVSDSPLWEGGDHMGSHQAGHDLAAELPDAPHGEEVLERYPQVGVLVPLPESPAAAPEIPAPRPGFLTRLLHRFPMLKRHPHPMVVHFPIVFMISTTVFTFLYLLTEDKTFESTALHCLAGGVLFTPVAIITGLLTWWLNYHLRAMRPVTWKLILSSVLLLTGLGALSWRLLRPEVLFNPTGWNLLYPGLISLLAPLVAAIGWFGAQITFPTHREE